MKIITKATLVILKVKLLKKRYLFKKIENKLMIYVKIA
jgi:hypothetical protein